MTSDRSGHVRQAAAVLLLLILIVTGVVWYLRRPDVEDRYPVTSREVTVPHGTETVRSADMWLNEQVVTTEGRDGVTRVFTYRHERLVNGEVTLREEVDPPRGKPGRVVVSEPTTEVVTIGTREGAHFAVNASQASGQPIGTIGPSGTMWIEATGTIVFAAGGGNAGVFGNSVYDYFWRPIRDDVPPGALLLGAGDGSWRALSELVRAGTAYGLSGTPGTQAYAVVNDAPRYFDDNRGSFSVRIWPEGSVPE